MSDPLRSAEQLIAQARQLYATDRNILAELDELDARLTQSLRVALVGSVKAGKSTLLNGLLGERIAPTDARECTRIVTCYHYGTTPSVTASMKDGRLTTVPTRRQKDRFELELDGLAPEDVDQLDVYWPAPGLQGITLIDTPGIASISRDVADQTDRFLLPEQGVMGADAVVYLLRSAHESDIRYIRALNERTRHNNSSIGSVAVLSRADELGAGRLTAMVSINQAVEQLRNHPELEGVCETIVPVAGLMGMGAMILRQADFKTLRDLAARKPEETHQLLLSGERFVTAREEWLPSELTRIDLLDRFGMYGIRIALAAVRGGVDDAAQLSAELLRRSGLDELRRVIDIHFRQRQAELKAHAVVLALHRLLRQFPVEGSTELLVSADDHMANAHTFTEMHLVGRIVGGQVSLPHAALAELERLIGGRGADIGTRLGFVRGDEKVEKLLASAVKHLGRWREKLENPLLDRATFQACKTAVRSCELMIIELMNHAPEAAETKEYTAASRSA